MPKSTQSLWYGLLNKIYDFKPDLIISTYIFISVALENIKRAYNIPAKIACMALDYGISPFWECTTNALDFMFLTGEYMIEPFIKRGFKKEQLIVSGIPVSNKFNIQKEKTEIRSELGLDQSLFTLIIMKASFFPIKESTIVKNLERISNKIQVVIINGKSEKSKKKLDKLIKKSNMQHNIINLGYTDKIADYFFASDLVLGKAGGLTTTEIITANLPSLIVPKLPSQEIHNKDFLCQNGCAIQLRKKNFFNEINDILETPSKLDKMKNNLQKIKKTNAVDVIFATLKDVPNADYSNINFNDTPKQVVSKINKQRKQDHLNTIANSKK